MQVYSLNPNFNDTVFKELIPTLRERKTKVKTETHSDRSVTVERTSKFIETELNIIEKMLTGEYRYNQMRN
jgi:hypothetical protein